MPACRVDGFTFGLVCWFCLAAILSRLSLNKKRAKDQNLTDHIIYFQVYDINYRMKEYCF